MASNVRSSAPTPDAQGPPNQPTIKRRRRGWSKFMLLARRTHLYAGLFLLPWVFLYGITGAMFNHQGLFPEVTIEPISAAALRDSPMTDFPSPKQLAQQIVDTLNSSTSNATITLAENHGAEFTNNVMFEVHESGNQHVIHFDPLQRSSTVVTAGPNNRRSERLLNDLHNIQLQPNPQDIARNSVSAALDSVGIETSSNPRPFGWTKLNFLANVDGQPARITYVLKDGHIDVMKFAGQHDMSPRQFFLRLHTSHGQPPHWNGRMIWSLFADSMAIAMVTWGLTGLLMWWQMRRTRMIGGAVMLASIVTAVVMYVAMNHFYATTTL